MMPSGTGGHNPPVPILATTMGADAALPHGRSAPITCRQGAVLFTGPAGPIWQSFSDSSMQAPNEGASQGGPGRSHRTAASQPRRLRACLKIQGCRQSLGCRPQNRHGRHPCRQYRGRGAGRHGSRLIHGPSNDLRLQQHRHRPWRGAPQTSSITTLWSHKICCWQTLGLKRPSGWASDITRTWPGIGPVFTSPQRDIYDVVLAAHDAAIAEARPGG